jgi:ABC-type amino acid transport system permease subunit
MVTGTASGNRLGRTARKTLGTMRDGIREYRRSIAGLFGLLAFLIVVITLLGSVGVLDLNFIATRWNTMYGPALLSLFLTNASFFIGFAAAIPLGLTRAYGPTILRRARGRPTETLSYARAKELYGSRKALWVVAGRKIRKALFAPAYGFATGYTEAMRGTPFYVQIWIVFYLFIFAWPTLPGLYIIIGLVALTLNTAGYQAEVLRAGFQSVGQGQIEAAKAIGMRASKVFLHITLPQALRLIILPLTNEWVSLFKASAIVSFIAVVELFYQSEQLGVNQGHPIEAFLLIAMMYLVINIPLSKALSYIERKKRIPGLGTAFPMPGRGRVEGAP